MLKLVIAPHPILSKPSQPVTSFAEDTQLLVAELLKHLNQDEAIGYAAVQFGVLKQVMVLDLKDNDDTERAEGFYPLVLINPHLTQTSTETVTAREACMSVPGFITEITRPESVTMDYFDQFGNKQTISASGWLARVLQHELDHLLGKTLLDHVSYLKRTTALRKLKKLAA